MSACRYCALYDLEAVKDRAGRVRSDRVARCLWAPTEPRPDSLTRYNSNPPLPGYMTPNDGDSCPAFRLP